MAVSSIWSSKSTETNTSRMTGIASGLDTDTIIKNLMKAEKAPLDKIKQKKQVAEWKRDAYREITSDIRTLKDAYFNVAKSSSNVKSSSLYKKFTVTPSDSNSVTTTVVNPDLVSPGESTIDIDHLATAGYVTSAALGVQLEGTAVMNEGDGNTIHQLSEKKFAMLVDGNAKEITLGTYTAGTTRAVFTADFQSKLDSAFGAGKITVALNDDFELKFTPAVGSNKITMGSGSSNNGLSIMGFTQGASNRVSTTTTLETIATNNTSLGLTFDGTDDVSIYINGTDNDSKYTFSKSDTLGTVIETINSRSEGTVTASYDQLNDKLVFTAKTLGKGANIAITTSTGTFLSGLRPGTISYNEGDDSVIYVNGSATPIIRNNNNVEVNGINYNLIKSGETVHKVTITNDTDTTYKTVKDFFDKYNDLIEKINTKLSDKYDRNYQPLTDAQKEGMSEAEINKWEEKAKTGLLRNDSLLQKFAQELRNAMSDNITDVSGNIFDIGLSSSSYLDKGKITIDETTLKNALTNTPDKVKNIFSRQSTTHPIYSRAMTSSQMSTRYNEEGIMNRFSDIVENYISTSLNSSNQKGRLLEKAGITNDRSEYKNSIYTELLDYDKRISNYQNALDAKESSYYKKYAALETALSKMNSQSSWLQSQLSSGG